MQKETIMKQLKKQARYAQHSLSRDLLYQTYGQACMARQLEAITREEFAQINHMTVYFMNTHARKLEEGR